MKLLKIVKDNIFLIFTLFLLAFIPLYPKLPLINVSHTWVYVRAEDFFVLLALTLWIFMVLFRKVKLKTPLTFPIFLFWIIVAFSTIHGVLILFPTLANVFPNVAFLSLIRRIEYMSLFFVAYCSIRDKKALNYVIWLMAIVLIVIVLYGLGQKFLGFPAFLTGNEEFAKGIPLQLSSLARVPSTFAGNYDLAAYLVLVIPIFASLFFAFKNYFARIFLLITAGLGFGLLFLTVSRVSFFVLMLSLVLLLIIKKKKLELIALFLAAGLALIIYPNLIQRFNQTVSYARVLVDAKTGSALGQVKLTDKEFFKDKTVLREFSSSQKTNAEQEIIPYAKIPDKVELLTPPNESTGESLPQGTGYVNLPLSPIIEKTKIYYFYGRPYPLSEAHVFKGDFLVKEARAYDLSFTTRFQGEWPRTIDAFLRNVFLGSGYGSVSLAVDNDYLRIFGETGILGFLSFALIFVVGGIYIRKAYRKANSAVVKSFILGFVLGTLGLLLNAFLIDVFEASKIAYTFWLLAGITLGISSLYIEDLDILKELKIVLTSDFAVALYILLGVFALFSPSYNNFFVGDDFTWLYWAKTSGNNILNYFTNAGGFFYRPGEKIYFYFMYNFFWLNQTFYHIVSITLHFLVALTSFFIFKRIFKNKLLAFLGLGLFLIAGGYQEAVFWISATGFLFTSLFTLFSLFFYINFKDKGKKLYFFLSLVFLFLAPLFHEMGVVVPLILIAYDFIFYSSLRKILNKNYFYLLLTLVPYFVLRFFANAHWQGGDYSYNLSKLPFNFPGNILGFLSLDFFGPGSLQFYETFRDYLRLHLFFASLVTLLTLIVFFFLAKLIYSYLQNSDRNAVCFGILFFVISLLPFLGLGNITSRYSYLSEIGFVIVLAIILKEISKFLNIIMERRYAYMIGVLTILLYSSLTLFQLQRTHIEWLEAGKISQNVLSSVQSVYSESWRGQTANLYFVNVPVRNGSAWIFPVGLNDAVSFFLQNQKFTIDILPSFKDASGFVGKSLTKAAIEFDKDGNIKKVKPESLNVAQK